MSKEEEKLTPEEVMQSLQDHEEGCERRQKTTNERFDKLEGRFDTLEGRFDKLEDKVDKHSGWFLGLAGLIITMMGLIVVAVGVNIVAMAYLNDNAHQYAPPSHTKVIVLDSQGRIIDSTK